MSKCIKELERIYGIRQGGDRKSNTDNLNLKTQEYIANQLKEDQVSEQLAFDMDDPFKGN